MKREEKEKQVAWLKKEFETAKALVIANYQGMTVAETTRLRAELRKHGITFKVLKNTLARRGYQGTSVEPIGVALFGPKAAVWTDSDDVAPAMAKVLVDYAKANPKFQLVKGVLKGKLMEPSEVEVLAKLPSREVLLGSLFGTMMAPIGAFVNTLAAVPRSFLNVLKAIEEKKAGETETASA